MRIADMPVKNSQNCSGRVSCCSVLRRWRRGAARDTLDAAAERYRPYMVQDIDRSLAEARTLNDRIAANDLAGAKKAWIDARVGWERSEVFTAAFVPDLDQEIDAWPNALMGFHAIEAKLFGAGSMSVGTETNALIFHLADLDVKVHRIDLCRSACSMARRASPTRSARARRMAASRASAAPR